MKVHKAADENAIRALLEYFNDCHDGYMRRVTFLKDVAYTEEGDICWPSEDARWEEIDMFKWDIEVELLLNSYEQASRKQVVVIRFEHVRSFRFHQDDAFDCADVYEVVLHESSGHICEFVFRVRVGITAETYADAVSITCPRITCTEL